MWRGFMKILGMKRKLPLVVILGSTGSGKTRLSLELAKKFDGEIIGADSMQIYRGLDISTAKATAEEQSLAPHHLIDILNPNEIFTVTQYRNRALGVIQDLVERNKLPVVVGGTNYYIEALLWKILIDDDFTETPGFLPNKEHELPSEVLHQKLKMLDPKMATRLHPNNKRKILRALEIIYRKGKKVSDILNEQQSEKGASTSGGGLRFDNVIVFWLQCQQDVLDERLDSRVDGMIEQGLVEELLHFHRLYNQKIIEPDYTKGIFQAIGFKEFHSYLVLGEDERLSDEGRIELNKAVEKLKMVTRRYARKQRRWVINRFLGRSDRQAPLVYGLDTTDISKFDKNVTGIAEEIVKSYIHGTNCPFEPLPKEVRRSTPNSLDETYECTSCNRIFVGRLQWEIHLKSGRHKRVAHRKKQIKQDSEATIKDTRNVMAKSTT